jgi:MFS superfamily sulfate permease-like transporter
MLVQKVVGTIEGPMFVVSIDAIKPSEHSPNEYFRVLWSVREKGGDKTVESIFIVKFTDPLLFSNKLRVYRDISKNEIVEAGSVATILLSHLVVDEVGSDINHSVEFFFAERPDGSGRYDGFIIWNHKGPFYPG